MRERETTECTGLKNTHIEERGREREERGREERERKGEEGLK